MIIITYAIRKNLWVRRSPNLNFANTNGKPFRQLNSMLTKLIRYTVSTYYCLTSSPSVAYTWSEHVVKISALSQVSMALCSCTHTNIKITKSVPISYHEEREIQVIHAFISNFVAIIPSCCDFMNGAHLMLLQTINQCAWLTYVTENSHANIPQSERWAAGLELLL